LKSYGGGIAERVRAAAPEPLAQLGRHGYIWLSTATAQLRLEPDFIMIGAQRCGTTSLFRALRAHPQVVAPTFHKGINYFDLNYYRGAAWYRGHFPIAEVARRRAGRWGRPVAFEASGYYMYHPWALERLARAMPTVKLVVMLRDPVERAYSAYKHEYARGYETETFEAALALEDDRLAGEIARMRADPAYESFPHRHHSYRHRGYYAEQLERAFKFFPRTQVHIIDSEAYFGQPGQEYRRLLKFLGLRSFEPAFRASNARPGPLMSAESRQMLTECYLAHDERLAKLLDQAPSWVHRGAAMNSSTIRPPKLGSV
jgi:Sulfotransferase domain